MTNNLDNNKCLASWAVFKELSDNDTRNVYDILLDFIKSSIYVHGIRAFTVSELTAIVNSDYEFNVKNAITAHTVQKLGLEIKDGQYLCNPNDYSGNAQIVNQIKDNEKATKLLLDKLCGFIKTKNSEEDVELNRKEISRSFARFILDNNYDDKYSTYISAFVIQCYEYPAYSSILKQVLDGVILYSGLTFNTPIKASSKWQNEISLYLDTELLFHMAGFNGTLYKQLFDDFYELVKEINTDSKQRIGKNLIHLKYFSYVPEEIDKFFAKATEIVNGKISLIPSVQAMKTITEGCKTESDVLEKKGFLISEIESHNIVQDSFNDTYYEESSYAQNLESQELVDKFHKEHPYYKEDDIVNSLISLSHVNVLRKGKSKGNFEKLKYYLLTENYITKQLSRSSDIRKEGETTLCTDLYYITNRMWYKLGKSFGMPNSPKVFNAISKAQIILSTKVNNSVYAKYEELVQKFNNKEISRENAVQVLYQLRSQVRKPEEVVKDDTDVTLMNINEDDISKYAENESFRKEQEKRVRKENDELKKTNERISTKAREAIKEQEVTKEQLKAEKAAHEATKSNRDEIAKANARNMVENESLRKEVLELREEKYLDKIRDYKEKREKFLRKAYKSAYISVILYVILTFCGIILSLFASKSISTYLAFPEWITYVLTILASQVIPAVRFFFSSMGIKESLGLICKNEVKATLLRFSSQCVRPSWINIHEGK